MEPWLGGDGVVPTFDRDAGLSDDLIKRNLFIAGPACSGGCRACDRSCSGWMGGDGGGGVGVGVFGVGGIIYDGG